MLVGNVGPGSASWSTENDWRRSLESMGHEVVPIHEHRWNGEVDLAGISVFFYVHTNGWGPEPEVVCEVLAKCRAAKVTTVGLHLDLWRGLERAKNIPTTPWFKQDYVFTADGGDPEFWKRYGVNHHWLPPAVLEASCYLAEPDRELYPHDIVFVAARVYHDEYPFRVKLQEWLPKTYGDRFKQYEHGWVKDPSQDPHIETNKMRGHNLNVLYASAKVVVGDSAFAGALHGYTSDRLFETAGRGGFLVYPAIPGVTDGSLVTPGEHIVTYEPGDFESLGSAIDKYLELPAERDRIRFAAAAHVKANHTYRNRLESVLNLVLGRI